MKTDQKGMSYPNVLAGFVCIERLVNQLYEQHSSAETSSTDSITVGIRVLVMGTITTTTTDVNRQPWQQPEQSICRFNIGTPTKMFTGVLIGGAFAAIASNPVTLGAVLAGGTAISITAKLIGFFNQKSDGVEGIPYDAAAMIAFGAFSIAKGSPVLITAEIALAGFLAIRATDKLHDDLANDLGIKPDSWTYSGTKLVSRFATGYLSGKAVESINDLFTSAPVPRPIPKHRHARQAQQEPNPLCNYTSFNETIVITPTATYPQAECFDFPEQTFDGAGFPPISMDNKAFRTKGANTTLCKISYQKFLSGVERVWTFTDNDCFEQVECSDGQYYGIRKTASCNQNPVSCGDPNLQTLTSNFCGSNSGLPFCKPPTKPEPVPVLQPTTITNVIHSSTCAEPQHTPSGLPLVECSNLTIKTYNGIEIGETLERLDYRAYATNIDKDEKCKFVIPNEKNSDLYSLNNDCLEQVKCLDSDYFGIRITKNCNEDNYNFCSILGDRSDFPLSFCANSTPWCLPPQPQPNPSNTQPPLPNVPPTQPPLPNPDSTAKLPQMTKPPLPKPSTGQPETTPEPTLNAEPESGINGGAIAGGVVGGVAVVGCAATAAIVTTIAVCKNKDAIKAKYDLERPPQPESEQQQPEIKESQTNDVELQDIQPSRENGHAAKPLSSTAPLPQTSSKSIAKAITVPPQLTKQYTQAMFDACASGSLDQLKLLIRELPYDFDVNLLIENEIAKDSITLLHVACSTGQTEIVDYLLKQQADANIKSVKGHTPLFLAVWSGHVKVVKQLLCAKADKSIESDDKTPLELAKEQGNADIIHLLEKPQSEASVSEAPKAKSKWFW
ncbi:hypothetical protein D5018_18355 [Parashewanella curva]|uniref:Uncharacterized protein n=1 Tax=Parashewanella curva TaxID=2338552 RepID=A0A3L8PS53_9GAMM|nr:ankyrin repeat domain-containing protein [Parashewanella curva]RLV58240.1 hypothetical protein D5018_18355 [Parashewanella curva]